jgi:class 3 adenylate cyclase
VAAGEFAHTSPVAVGEPQRKPGAVAALRALVEQTRDWAETRGRYANPKRKQALLDRCAEALANLGGAP